MDKSRSNKRRLIIGLIVVLTLVQVAILGYLWSLFRPSEPQDAAEPAPFQFQWPSASTANPDDTRQTPAPDAAEIAVGLIIVTDEKPERLQTSYVRSTSESEIAIPVFKITEDAFETLLERLRVQYQDLSSAPPTLPLNAQVQQTLMRSPVTTTFTANVAGLLPGSDPNRSAERSRRSLTDEVLLVGAHYDHIGQSPDGLYFPGAPKKLQRGPEPATSSFVL